MTLEGKVAAITGAGNGIGRAISLAMAKEGVRIACLDLDLAAAERTAAEAVGGAFALPLDVGESESIADMTARLGDTVGKVDILVNAAGINFICPLDKMSRDDMRRVFEINVFGLVETTQAVVRLMSENGRVINIASINGRRPGAGGAAYGMSKAAVISATQVMALEFIARGIVVNAIAPGFTQTAMWDRIEAHMQDLPGGIETFRKNILARIPAGRMAEPQDIARAAVFLAGPSAGYVVGQTINVDGGVLFN